MFFLFGTLLSCLFIATALVISFFGNKNGVRRFVPAIALLGAVFLTNNIEDTFILGNKNTPPIFTTYSVFSLQLISAGVAFYFYRLLHPDRRATIVSLLTLLPVMVTGLGISMFLSKGAAFTRVYSLAELGALLPHTKIGLLYLSILLATGINLMLMIYICSVEKVYYRKYVYQRYDNIYRLQTNWISPLLMLFVITVLFSLLSDLITAVWISYLSLGLWGITLTLLAWYITHQHNPEMEFLWSKKLKKSVNKEELTELVIRNRYHIKTGITINSLAEELSVNAYSLNKYFASMGSDFFTYINTIRIEHAIELLTADDGNDLTQRDIADICGFISKKNMYLTFNVLTGTFPNQYKRKGNRFLDKNN